MTKHDDVQLALIPADSSLEPVLLIPDHLTQVAHTGCVSDVRNWTQFSGGSSRGSVETVADSFRELKLSRARVGLEMGPHDRMDMSLPFFNSLQSSLPDVKFVESSEILSSVRKIKSPLEIDKLRTACNITCKSVEVGVDAVREGMSEKELAQVIA